MAGTPTEDGLPVPGGVSARLWEECELEAYRALDHPFVVGLGLGVLPK